MVTILYRGRMRLAAHQGGLREEMRDAKRLNNIDPNLEINPGFIVKFHEVGILFLGLYSCSGVEHGRARTKNP